MTWKDVLKYRVRGRDSSIDGNRMVTCPNCNGLGEVKSIMYYSAMPGGEPERKTCPVCYGKGQVTQDVADRTPRRPPERTGPAASQA